MSSSTAINQPQTNDNSQNLYRVSGANIDELYAKLKEWQEIHRKRLLHFQILPHGETGYTCIFLTNPTEVTIAGVYSSDGRLWVNPRHC